jgi:hypothetical protein
LNDAREAVHLLLLHGLWVLAKDGGHGRALVGTALLGQLCAAVFQFLFRILAK